MKRRTFLLGLIAAPAIVRASSLMHIRQLIVPPPVIWARQPTLAELRVFMWVPLVVNAYGSGGGGKNGAMNNVGASLVEAFGPPASWSGQPLPRS